MQNPRALFTRWPGNPILTAHDLSEPVNSVFNPGAVRFRGETLLIMRAEGFSGHSRFVIARSADGIANWQVDSGHDLIPDPANHPEDHSGIEDARIVEAPGFGFFITFTSYSEQGPVVSLARTEDFRHFERLGVVCPADDKDAALFPRQFDGHWLLIHRPLPHPAQAGIVPGNIYLSRSTDLKNWAAPELLLAARGSGWWDAGRIGLGPPPLKTPEGWLILYHGIRVTASGSLYRSGLALLDLEDPMKVIARATDFVFGPETAYERSGDVPNVVFPEGWVLDPNGHTLRVYYGAADSSVCLVSAEVPALLAFLQDASENTVKS
jgi:predicted GH43/DUF377 family glycosyl hydrolase